MQRVAFPFDQVQHLARLMVRFFSEDFFDGILCFCVAGLGRCDGDGIGVRYLDFLEWWRRHDRSRFVDSDAD